MEPRPTQTHTNNNTPLRQKSSSADKHTDLDVDGFDQQSWVEGQTTAAADREEVFHLLQALSQDGLETHTHTS